eukprot:TRINITY_DN96343_c0_g1_i1.p2 TRINITY_DN96343_c0_g1~~TRINITY_DN96343_c0_g1_i1.p2  ORF type:complete len:122 (-),score=3.32 TRINITY_DN96343_c0_g1_i1:97-462(-)
MSRLLWVAVLGILLLAVEGGKGPGRKNGGFKDFRDGQTRTRRERKEECRDGKTAAAPLYDALESCVDDIRHEHFGNGCAEHCRLWGNKRDCNECLRERRCSNCRGPVNDLHSCLGFGHRCD